MADIDEKQQSEIVRITGDDENNIAGVSDIDGSKSLNVNVSNQLEVEGSLISGSGLQAFTIESDQSMSQTFQDLVNVSGEVGFLYGFKINFSNENVRFRVEIDGVESFDLSMDFIDDMNFEDFNNTGLVRWFGKGNYGELEFFPSSPIKYENSLKVQVRKTSGWNIEVERALIFYG